MRSPSKCWKATSLPARRRTLTARSTWSNTLRGSCGRLRVAIDPRHLKPSELCRLLNSTPLRTVIDERQLYRHRMLAGFRIGDGRHVDLFRYVAWLVNVKNEPDPEAAGYGALKERARARNAALSLEGRDIGELPPVLNPERKEQAARSFRFSCEMYFPQTFHLAWSRDHLKVIAKIEMAVLHGGLFALAMPRGSGKTTLAECACLWAILFGHREFVALVGASEVHAEEMLDSIKMALEGNGRLLEDFPRRSSPFSVWRGLPTGAPVSCIRGNGRISPGRRRRSSSRRCRSLPPVARSLRWPGSRAGSGGSNTSGPTAARFGQVW